eukprot:7116300-Prymnesium_polylepis.1
MSADHAFHSCNTHRGRSLKSHGTHRADKSVRTPERGGWRRAMPRSVVIYVLSHAVGPLALGLLGLSSGAHPVAIDAPTLQRTLGCLGRCLAGRGRRRNGRRCSGP